MASGHFSSEPWSGQGDAFERHVEVIWSSTNDTANNTSTITWNAYIRSNASSTTHYIYAKKVHVNIGGSDVYLIGDTSQPTYKDDYLGGGTVTVSHEPDGTRETSEERETYGVAVGIGARFYSYSSENSTYSGRIDMTRNPVYTLEIAPSNSTLTVNRTSCAGVGATGALTAGEKRLNLGDVLVINGTAGAGYNNLLIKVNNNNYTAGSNYSVTGGTRITSSASKIETAATVTASDALIESTSTIQINKSSPSHKVSLEYRVSTSTKTVSGYINPDGSSTGSLVKFTETTVPFVVPESFYECIPNDQSVACQITCKTWDASGATRIGSDTTATFNANVFGLVAAPLISNTTAIDTNTTVTQLTGSNTKFIRYKSDVSCSMAVQTRKCAGGISAATINGGATTASGNTRTRTISGLSSNNFTFYAKDSRGATRTQTRTIGEMVNYIPLTCRGTAERQSPTSSLINLRVTGNFYNGSFGAKNNQLLVQWRAKKTGDSSFGTWHSSIFTTVISNNTYTATGTLDGSQRSDYTFDYENEYQIQFRARDGGATSNASPSPVLTTTESSVVIIKKGVPIFDWGENDFNMNVPLNVNDKLTMTTKTHSETVEAVRLILESRGISLAGGADLAMVGNPYSNGYEGTFIAGPVHVMGVGSAGGTIGATAIEAQTITIGGGSVADFIIEQGSKTVASVASSGKSATWYYRKYNSGNIELFLNGDDGNGKHHRSTNGTPMNYGASIDSWTKQSGTIWKLTATFTLPFTLSLCYNVQVSTNSDQYLTGRGRWAGGAGVQITISQSDSNASTSGTPGVLIYVFGKTS